MFININQYLYTKKIICRYNVINKRILTNDLLQTSPATALTRCNKFHANQSLSAKVNIFSEAVVFSSPGQQRRRRFCCHTFYSNAAIYFRRGTHKRYTGRYEVLFYVNSFYGLVFNSFVLYDR